MGTEDSPVCASSFLRNNPHSGYSLRLPPRTWARELPRMSAQAPTDLIPDNGKAERFAQTSLREWAYARA